MRMVICAPVECDWFTSACDSVSFWYRSAMDLLDGGESVYHPDLKRYCRMYKGAVMDVIWRIKEVDA